MSQLQLSMDELEAAMQLRERGSENPGTSVDCILGGAVACNLAEYRPRH